jgi:hypothetical protein
MSLVHQETWVRFGTNGIGISDHQNRYSNGVRIGNWTENEYGDELKATSSDHVPFTAESTAQVDYMQRDRDPDGSKVTKLGNMSNVQMPHGPEQTHELTHMTSTYDLTMSHVEGPRRVDTMLWSGVTKIDNGVPTAVHAKSSLLEKKKAEWAAAKESNWQTAYSKQYVQPEGAEREMRGVVFRRKDDANFSKDRRPHLELGLRAPT